MRISREKEKFGDSVVIKEEKSDFNKDVVGDSKSIPVKLTVTQDSRSLLFGEDEVERRDDVYKGPMVRFISFVVVFIYLFSFFFFFVMESEQFCRILPRYLCTRFCGERVYR